MSSVADRKAAPRLTAALLPRTEKAFIMVLWCFGALELNWSLNEHSITYISHERWSVFGPNAGMGTAAGADELVKIPCKRFMLFGGASSYITCFVHGKTDASYEARSSYFTL